ncbi:binding-protein-dependent transport systems inner membrane component [Ignisphaera aggregans DSM 17230]|uniref:Binding-protein-dependent transport systems inner membrane component n=1 Tax=Ignisphaera aggregans (strain DSM 17230 / JCM 13409 / AQ1.S1) TaxID=583356 RepID=E0SSU5_IGNAA|nr:binding-protein-dependent transport systems inner membrane component [Ignisphaera aggregans DSM 17230]
MGLLRYIAIRAGLIIPTVLILYTLVFIILRILPGDPVLAVLGTKNIPVEQLEEIRRSLGLDKPYYIQYFEYLWRVLHGDFGTSMIIRGRSIAIDLVERFPATVELSIAGLLVSLAIGIATGFLAAVKRDTKVDIGLRIFGIVTYTLFIPWVGLLFQLVFGVWLGLLPISGRIDPDINLQIITGLYVLDSLITGNMRAFTSALKHLILPALTLGLVLSGPYVRLVRNNLVKALESNYVFAYRARGVRERKILLHAFRNALIPVVTYAGLQFALLLGGAVLTETTFDWPGIGTYLVEKVSYRDYPAIQAVVIVFAFFVGFISLIVDLIYAVLDPRIRY